MNTPIALPILIHNSQSAELSKLGIDYDIADSDVREMTFFNINSISAYTDDRYDLPSPFSEVHANGSEYICNMSIDKLRAKLGVC